MEFDMIYLRNVIKLLSLKLLEALRSLYVLP